MHRARALSLSLSHTLTHSDAGEETDKQISSLNEELTSLKLTVAELEKERSPLSPQFCVIVLCETFERAFSDLKRDRRQIV